MFKKPLRTFLLCFVPLLAAGCSTALLNGDRVTVFFSNDIRGEFENCGCAGVQLGGLSRKARLFRAQEAKCPGMLRLDAGNLLFGKRPARDFEARELLLKADYIVSAYNAMGCDAFNISENDLLLGMSALEQLRGRAKFPFLSSNILSRDSGSPVFEPWVIKKIGEVTVAVLGVCPPDGAFIPELRVEDPAAAVRSSMEALRGRSDFIVVLSGLGLELDRDLARRVPGIGMIISARSDRLMEQPIVENGTTIVQAFNRGQYVGRADIQRKGKTFSVTSRLIPLEPDMGEEQTIVMLGNEYKAQVNAMNRRSFSSGTPGARAAESRAGYAGSDACAACHVLQYESWRVTPHARAYQTLAGKNAQYRSECLACHTTAFGEPGGFSPSQENSPMANVQCEACHGPAGGHAGAENPPVRNAGKEICLGCHTEKNSPKFDYATYLPLVICPKGGTSH